MKRPRGGRGNALAEFALAWPIVLLLVLATVQLAVYGVEAYAARASALVGARVGSEAGGSPATASAAAIQALSPSLVETSAVAWCPPILGRGAPPAGAVWVCAVDQGGSFRVAVGGSVPAIVPLPVGLPLHAGASLAKETFQP